MEIEKFNNPGLDAVPNFMRALETTRQELASEEWKSFIDSSKQIRRWRYFLCNDPYTRWSYLKPKGYAGDATVMDFAYMHRSICKEIIASGNLGLKIYNYTSSSPQSQSARKRIELIASELNEFCKTKLQGTVSVASYASGHGRELELLFPHTNQSIAKFVAIDSDQEALHELLSSSNKLPVELVNKNVFRFNRKNTQRFDFIYSLGLFDYLESKSAVLLAQKMWDSLKSGGKMIIANLSHSAGNIGYCEAIMDWWMITRSQDDMSAIVKKMKNQSLNSQCEIKQEGCFHYLTLQKMSMT